MATKIKAVESIIEWDAEMGRMAILNPGDVAEVGDNLAATKIDAGAAESAAPKAKAEASPAPTPTTTQNNAERDAARARYAELVGKKPFPGWSVDQLNEKIAAAEAAAAADAEAKAKAEAAAAQQSEDGSEGGEGDGSDGGPADEEGAPV